MICQVLGSFDGAISLDSGFIDVAGDGSKRSGRISNNFKGEQSLSKAHLKFYCQREGLSDGEEDLAIETRVALLRGTSKMRTRSYITSRSHPARE